MWTLDTRIEIAELGYAPTLSGRRAVAPLLEARDAVLALQAAEHPAREDYGVDREPFCLTCGDRGRILIGDAGNQEIETNCPDCGPQYQ